MNKQQKAFVYGFLKAAAAMTGSTGSIAQQAPKPAIQANHNTVGAMTPDNMQGVINTASGNIINKENYSPKPVADVGSKQIGYGINQASHPKEFNQMLGLRSNPAQAKRYASNYVTNFVRGDLQNLSKRFPGIATNTAAAFAGGDYNSGLSHWKNVSNDIRKGDYYAGAKDLLDSNAARGLDSSGGKAPGLIPRYTGYAQNMLMDAYNNHQLGNHTTNDIPRILEQLKREVGGYRRQEYARNP
jgi:hypothetical protein